MALPTILQISGAGENARVYEVHFDATADLETDFHSTGLPYTPYEHSCNITGAPVIDNITGNPIVGGVVFLAPNSFKVIRSSCGGVVVGQNPPVFQVTNFQVVIGRNYI